MGVERVQRSDDSIPRILPPAPSDRPRPLVSVVIATYNMGKYLCQAVNSVLAQPAVDLEVIVVDDGSQDETQAVLQPFRGDPRVRIISQENRGQPRAKNAGLHASRGRFLAFCDADDFWLPDKLALQLPLFAANPRVGVVCSHFLTMLPDGSRQESLDFRPHRGKVLDELFIRNIVPFGTAVVRRECFEQDGGFDESIPMGIDWDLWLRFAVAWEFDYVHVPTYVYRLWEGQMSHNWRGRYECALRIMNKFLERHPGALPESVVARGFADTYTNYAAAHLNHTDLTETVTNLRKALAHNSGFWPAWRLLLTIPWRRLRAL